MISTTVRPRVVQKGLICEVFIGLKKRKLVMGGGLMISWSWNHFFSLLEGKSAFISEDGSESPPYPSKNTSRFFLKRFNHYFSCLCGTSGFLVLVGGKWTQLSPQFTVWLRVDFYKRHFTSLLGFCFRFNSHEVYSAINGTFFLNHDFDILMHYFVLSLKKKK